MFRVLILRVLILAFVLIVSKVNFAQTPTNGLVGVWLFSGNANDQSGNNLNGIVYGATLTTDRCGNPNSAYYFNGSNAYITVPDNPILNLTQFSICAWVNSSVSNPTIVYEIFLRGTLPYDYGINFNANLAPAGFYNSNGLYSTLVPLNDNVSAGNWHFIVLTNSGTMATLYIDNVLIASQSCSPVVPMPGNLMIGTYNGSVDMFNGAIDDIRLYNRPLSASEVAELYNTNCCTAAVPSISNQPAVQCAGATVNLSAIGGTAYNWYQTASSKTILATGENFTTPVLNQTTTFYVSNINGGCESARDSITILVNSTPVASIVPSQTICMSDLPITLKASGTDIIWYADSAGAKMLNTGNNYTPTVSSPGIYSYFLNANNNGCKGSIIKTSLTVNANPSKPISNNSVVCYNGNALNLRVISNVSTNSVMNWYQSNVLSGSPDFVGQSINVNLLPLAIYTYYIYQKDTLTGCYSTTDTMNVTVNPTPTISFVITPINPLVASDSVKISVNTDNVAEDKFLWDNGDTLNTITYLPDSKSLICLRVIDQDGCIGSACTDGSYQLKCGDYFIPNAFSPNGGGHNEVLYVRGLCDYTQIEFSIYDRWGERVFYTITPEIGWDGYYRGQPMNQGVYIYYLIVEFKDGTTIKKTGNVTLVR